MISIRESSARGFSNHDWLKSYHTFSFAQYYDSRFSNFGVLRVINEDTVAPGMGFKTHSHRDMEIISYVLEGEMEHKDSMGNGSIIRPGEIQRMTAGSGVTHSEFNHSIDKPLHFLQIWVIPDQRDLHPSYEQKMIQRKENSLILIGSTQGSEQAVKIHQDLKLYVGYFNSGQTFFYDIDSERKIWVQLIKGNIRINDLPMHAGDGASLEHEKQLVIVCDRDAEFLVFDMAV